ncbi:Outer envelope pore protein 24 [Spatholobus suberectus]|nr:Outer envelope pore protein 24 [Spatholobus suberectus]
MTQTRTAVPLATVTVNAGAVNIHASTTQATFTNGPSLIRLGLTLEKPGTFKVDYSVLNNDFRFQFMKTVRLRVAEMPLNLTFKHSRGCEWKYLTYLLRNKTILNGTLVLNSANKVSANYVPGTSKCKLRYVYAHKGDRGITFKPCYDVAKNSWDFAISKRFNGDDSLRASYNTSSRMLGLEWSWNSKLNRCYKISASLNLDKELRLPRVTAETTWNFEM